MSSTAYLHYTTSYNTTCRPISLQSRIESAISHLGIQAQQVRDSTTKSESILLVLHYSILPFNPSIPTIVLSTTLLVTRLSYLPGFSCRHSSALASASASRQAKVVHPSSNWADYHLIRSSTDTRKKCSLVILLQAIFTWTRIIHTHPRNQLVRFSPFSGRVERPQRIAIHINPRSSSLEDRT